MAIAHAVIGRPAVDALGLHHAETSVELTYQMIVSQRFVVQPDVDYVRHPDGLQHARDGVAFGLRFVFTGAYPGRMAASDPGDPTIPPDGSPAPSGDSGDE